MRFTRVVPLVLFLLLPSVSNADSILVRPDGTGDFPTIQTAVDAAAEGDTILLSPGTFTGPGNVNVDSRSKGLLVRGAAGAAATTIDCAYTARAFLVHDNASSFFVVSDITVTCGWGGTGGAIRCINGAVELRDAIIKESIACFGKAVGCVDGQAAVVRCRLLRNACIATAPCYGPGAPTCEGLQYGGVVSGVRSLLRIVDNYGEGNADGNGGDGQVVYALDSSVEMVGNRFYRNRTFDGTPTVTLERCDVMATANELVENAAWTSGVHMIECSGELRGNFFDENEVHAGPGGVASEYSSASISFNFFRDNHGESVFSNGSTGDITRNLILGTAGTCCAYGTAMMIFGCLSFVVSNNTFYNNGVGSGLSFWASEIHVPANATHVFRNVVVHDAMDNVADCEYDSGCSVPSPPDPGNLNWFWGNGAIFDITSPGGSCFGIPLMQDPMHRDPAHDNFFLRPGSSCDVDTTIAIYVIKEFYGALPKGSRPSGLLNVTRPADAWPIGLHPGTEYDLTGFSITNAYRYDASINYRVTSTSGLLRDGGDPLSLVGATPVLAPGESFTPPPAALIVPGGEQDIVVAYTYAYAPALNIVDTVQTTIHFGNPVAVRVSSFSGKQHGGSVILEWKTGGAIDVAGWHVYRAESAGPFKRMTSAPLRASSRSFGDDRVASGIEYRYRLVALDPDEIIVGEIRVTPTIPLTLEQNTPNPFRTETTIRFSMPRPTRAELNVYAVDGSLVRALLNERVRDNARAVAWDGRDAGGRPVPSGVYFCRLTVDGQVLTRKIVLAR